MRLALREVVHAILQVVTTGCQWRTLPNDLPNPKRVYYRFRLAASSTDRDGAKAVLNKVERPLALRLLKWWVDSAYQGGLETWFQQQWGIQLAIVARLADQKGFVVQPRRRVVERTFAWLGKYGRLSKDYELCVQSREGMIYLAFIHTLLKRLAA